MQAAPTQSPQTSSNVPSQPQLSASDQPCYLLELPAELRNRIYELVLLSPNKINVRKNFKPPGILAASRQIRSEAWKIFFAQNDFRFIIHSCDGSLVLKWTDTIGLRNARICLQPQGRPSWANLFHWMSQAYERNLALPRKIVTPSGAHKEKTAAVITAVQNIVAKAVKKKKPWEEVEFALQNIHFAISALDDRWA